MKKVKRFQEGGYEDTDDYKNLILAADREAVEYEGEKIAKPLREAAAAAKAEPMKMASFKEAFKEARGRGDKTFEYMGKKYTTDVAAPKATPKAESKTEAPKSRTFAEKQAAAGEKMQGAYRGAAENVKRGLRSLVGMKKGGMLKNVDAKSNPGLSKLPEAVRNKMGYKRSGGKVKKYASGGSVSSASKRADGIAQRGKTRGRMV